MTQGEPGLLDLGRLPFRYQELLGSADRCGSAVCLPEEQHTGLETIIHGRRRGSSDLTRRDRQDEGSFPRTSFTVLAKAIAVGYGVQMDTVLSGRDCTKGLGYLSQRQPT